jgi:Right handed beta helix region
MSNQLPLRAAPDRRRLIGLALPAAALAAFLISGCTGGASSTSVTAPVHPTGTASSPAITGPAPSAPTAVCGQPILDSRWHYDGSPGTFDAQQAPAGLPTFGSPGSDFPSATQIIVVPAGNNTSAANNGTYAVSHAVVYFEPGVHQLEGGMYTGHNTAYVGGYSTTTGKAILDGVDGATGGTGKGGSRLAESTPSSGSNVYDTWEYLTIRNFTSSVNNSVMGNVNGGATDIGDVYQYDTIGPNEYGYAGDNKGPATGESSGGGYAIDAGSNTTIAHNCLTRNAQGAFNINDATNIDIEANEISANGLGVYPDSAGSGASPFACGCSGGGKIFFSLNADVVGNYVHNNYNTGIWFDFDNAGATIAHNYVASNWGSGIAYEASYNADISDNTLVGNGWASDGPWPGGVNGGSCYGGIPCSEGYGPVSGGGGGNPYAAIDLSNSGGDSSLSRVAGGAGAAAATSRYSGELLVTGNVLQNNFGGVKVYTDTNRYPGDISNDSACSIPLGALNQANSSLYYRQSKVLVTGGDAAISGSSVSSSGGTMTLCADYGTNDNDQAATSGQAPSPGMAVYDENSGAFLGTVASVSSAHSFTLNRAPGNRTGSTLLLSAYGGCGPADYYGGGPGVSSGQPRAAYWDNCLWASRNVTVRGNTFAINASTVQGCTTARNMCGFMENAAFNAGQPKLMQFWDSYPNYIAKASGGLGNVWSQNTYTWSGPGAWRFWAGTQGNEVSQQQWQAAPYEQDAGSTFG